MGLDEVLVYRFDAARGTLTRADPPSVKTPAHSGARHLSFHPNGRFAYVIEEQGSSIMALAWDAGSGAFSPIGTMGTLPANSNGIGISEDVLVHPSGKFVYGSNRGNDSIAVFTVDPDRGALTAVECVSSQGKWPKGISIDPFGNYLFAANQHSHTVVQFRIDRQTGRLTPTGARFEAGSPACIRFVPAP
jgi:6-phosphogluconolactonase